VGVRSFDRAAKEGRTTFVRGPTASCPPVLLERQMHASTTADSILNHMLKNGVGVSGNQGTRTSTRPRAQPHHDCTSATRSHHPAILFIPLFPPLFFSAELSLVGVTPETLAAKAPHGAPSPTVWRTSNCSSRAARRPAELIGWREPRVMYKTRAILSDFSKQIITNICLPLRANLQSFVKVLIYKH